jgi:hypothetical protein
MAKNLDITNSNSDSNNILKTLIIILIVAAIAYIIYYLYINSTKDSVTNNNMAYTQSQSKNNIIESEHNMNKHVINKNINKNSNNHIQHEENISEVNYKMNGGLHGNNNPIMNKINTLPTGDIVGQNNIEHFSQNQNFSDERNSSCFPKEQLTAEELLPQDNSSLWAQVNPSGEGSLKDRNFLQSGYHIGINTVGQTLRNANLQLRSEPPCPQVKVSPWIQSTIEPDLGRKPFEIGGCA